MDTLTARIGPDKVAVSLSLGLPAPGGDGGVLRGRPRGEPHDGIHMVVFPQQTRPRHRF